MAAAVPLAIAATGFGLSCYSPALEAETAVSLATTDVAATMAVKTTVVNGLSGFF